MAVVNDKMRIYHRYLGFFLAGIMAMYAVSGVILIFRDTDFLKQEQQVEKQLKPNLNHEELGKELRIRDFKVTGETEDLVFFAEGNYNKHVGIAAVQVKELPFFLNKMTKLHKANSKSPLFFLNIFFGVALLFFVVSAFYMFMPHTSVFKKGLYFALVGVVLTLILIFI